MRLKDQVAVVTGAGRNIGEAISEVFVREGAKVAVVDIDPQRAQDVSSRLTKSGGIARGFVANVAVEQDVKNLIHDVSSEWGGIDILVNNAAISDKKNIFEISKEQWDRVIAVTLTGPFLMSKYVAEAMVASNIQGKIVNVASTSGFSGRNNAIAYTSAKGGVVNFTRSLAVQLAPHGIRVNAVVPNKIGSPVGEDKFNPSRLVVNLRNRPGEPIDLAHAVLFLVSDESDFIVGDMLFVDGGLSATMVE